MWWLIQISFLELLWSAGALACVLHLHFPEDL
jgi:hypothetical protein